MTLLKSFMLLTLTLSITGVAYGSDEVFFKNNDITHFQLEAPFAQMAEFKKTHTNFMDVKSQKYEGILSYKDALGIVFKQPVKISVKGFSSIQLCPFPKLELKIKKIAGTIFENIKSIDLNTHCDDPAVEVPSTFANPYKSMYNAHREVVSYRIQEVLGLTAYLTKPVFLKYIDVQTGVTPASASKESYQAFFIEDKSEFIKRNNMIEIKGTDDNFKSFELSTGKSNGNEYQFLSVDQNKNLFNLSEFAKIELLQNLIGNGDWFIKANEMDSRFPEDKTQLWNSKVFKVSESTWLPVAQDFNFSIISWIEVSVDFSSSMQLEKKFFNMLDADEKNKLLQDFFAKRELVLAQLDLIKMDPEFSRINTYVEKRFQFIYDNLK